MTLQIDRQPDATTTDPWWRDDLLLPVLPSDREVVASLHRLAAAQAQLLAAEQAADEASGARPGPRRIPEIEEARTALLWTQADLLTAPRTGRRRRAAVAAADRLTEVLGRHGFRAFDDYLRSRRPAATVVDPRLQLARREYDAAHQAWVELCAEFADRTVVIDLTGDEPRRLA